MKRFPAYDPPEYVNWEAETALVDAFEAACAADPDRESVIAALGQEQLLG